MRRGLAEYLPKHTVRGVVSSYDKSFPNSPTDVERFLIGAQCTAVRRRGKVLMIDFDSLYSLVIHLKMTGQLVYRAEAGARFGAGHPNNSLIGELPDASTRVVLELNGSQPAKLFFNDQRRFGWMRLMPTIQIDSIDFMKKLGPEPLAADFTVASFLERLERRPKSAIKAVLLDQSVIAGVGNIYADESLWAAKIHPASRNDSITTTQKKRLFTELRAVLQMSIDQGGSSDRNYVDASGRRGSYLTFANVFRRQGLACPRCGQEIVKIRVAGRGTHICPREQRIAS